MIPKTIHYCWFGGNPLPKLAKRCIKSWKKYCPDYEIIRWDESNYDISAAPLYVRQAYEAKKWAFVTDYVRLQVVYDHGGIYLDTDVELLQNWDHLLESQAFFGFEDGKYIATGLGFGAEAGTPIVKEMMDDYQDIPFILDDGSYNAITCPVRNTAVFLRHGLRQDGESQVIAGCRILPSVCLCPVDYETGKKGRTSETLSIHHFSASWQSSEQKKRHKRVARQICRANLIHAIRCTPNRVVRWLLGIERYETLKKKLK